MSFFPEEDELRILYWEQGLSFTQIAKIKQVSTTTIRKHMLGAGVPKRSRSESLRRSKLGELNPKWGGNNIQIGGGRQRAKRYYPLKPCRICGKIAERHHKDDNPLNNEPSNIDFLCRKHHMEADGRMERRNNGQFRSKFNVKALCM